MNAALYVLVGWRTERSEDRKIMWICQQKSFAHSKGMYLCEPQSNFILFPFYVPSVWWLYKWGGLKWLDKNYSVIHFDIQLDHTYMVKYSHINSLYFLCVVYWFLIFLLHQHSRNVFLVIIKLRFRSDVRKRLFLNYFKCSRRA